MKYKQIFYIIFQIPPTQMDSTHNSTINQQHYPHTTSISSSDFPSSDSTTPIHSEPHSDEIQSEMQSEMQSETKVILDIQPDEEDDFAGEQKFCNGYGEWGYVPNRSIHSILPDLKTYPFTDDIKNRADAIYNKMRYQVRRGKMRFQMLFFCTYCAHLELKRDVNPIQLGKQFDLTQGDVQRCDSIFSPLQTGYRPPSTSVSPLGYLPDYCQNMKLSQESIDDIMLMSANILRKDPSLLEENPQTVAAGLLRYYNVTNGITNDDPQKITQVTGRSMVTIDGMFKKIAAVDNL